MKLLFIGRKNLFNLDDVSEEYEIYKASLALGHDVEFFEFPLPKNNLSLVDYDWVFIAKTVTDKQEILDLRAVLPKAKIAYWTPDYCMLKDTGGDFQNMVRELDLYIGGMKETQSWFLENNVRYQYWPFDVACEVFQKESNPRIANFHPQTPFPDVIPIGFTGNWSHNPWRANVLREFQYYFGDDKLHITTPSVTEFTLRDDLRNVHHPLYGHKFNQIVALTKINLSMESMSNYGYWASRAARIMAAGGFVLVWYCDGIEKSLGPDKENVVYFRTVQEGIKLAEYYLKHEDERQFIAEHGNEFVNKYLRPINRVKELFYENIFV